METNCENNQFDGERPVMRPCNCRQNGVRRRPGNCGCMGNGKRPGGMRPGWRPADGMRYSGFSDESDLHSEWNCKSRMINGSKGQSMVIGCEGQTMSGCYMNDPMDRLGDAFPPVMSYVPWQQWGDLYEPDCGIYEGTVFKDLNYVFCGTRC